jgi:hypothetical protein
MKITVILDVTSCSAVYFNRRFGGICIFMFRVEEYAVIRKLSRIFVSLFRAPFIDFTLKMEAVHSSKMFLNIYHTTCNITERKLFTVDYKIRKAMLTNFDC